MSNHYEREGMKNYLVYDVGDEESAMEINMLLHCRPDWLPVPELRVLDGEYKLYYLVSGMKPFSIQCTEKKFNESELKLLLKGACEVIQDAEEYLLNPDDIVINPNYMFVAPTISRLKFLYFPGYGVALSEQVFVYVEKLMSYADTVDNETASLIYNLHNDICSEGPGLELLLRYANGEYEDRLGIGNAGIYSLPKSEPLLVAEPDIGSLYVSESRITSVIKGAKSILKPKKVKRLSAVEGIKLISLDGANPDIYPGKSCIIGRYPETSDYAIDRPEISRLHARLFVKGEELFIEDLGSKNGVYINDKRLQKNKVIRLSEDDDVCIGGAWFRVQKG